MAVQKSGPPDFYDGGRQGLYPEKHWEDKVPLEKIYNLNNGVDLQEFDQNCQQYRLDDPDLLDESTFKVVYTGSIRLVNNLGKIVEMAEYLQKQGRTKSNSCCTATAPNGSS